MPKLVTSAERKTAYWQRKSQARALKQALRDLPKTLLEAMAKRAKAKDADE